MNARAASVLRGSVGAGNPHRRSTDAKLLPLQQRQQEVVREVTQKKSKKDLNKSKILYYLCQDNYIIATIGHKNL